LQRALFAVRDITIAPEAPPMCRFDHPTNAAWETEADVIVTARVICE
jgi:hypothetical protein